MIIHFLFLRRSCLFLLFFVDALPPPSSNLALTYYHHKCTKSKQNSYNHFFEFHTWIFENVQVVKHMWSNDLLIQNTSKHWLWLRFKTYEIAAPAQRGNIHAAVPLRSNPRFQITHKLRHTNMHRAPWSQTNSAEPITRQNVLAAPTAHTRYLPSPVGATLPEKTQAFVPRLPPKPSPCNIHTDHTAITMRFETSCRQPASLYAHYNTTWQHSCSHSTAIQRKIPNHPISATHKHAQSTLKPHHHTSKRS